MILVELSKTDFTEHGRFLGEHKWKDILRRPDAEHKKRTTQVFHSFYSTPRDAEKDGAFEPSSYSYAELFVGWKPFQLDMRQCFKDWIPGKGLVSGSCFVKLVDLDEQRHCLSLSRNLLVRGSPRR